MRRRRCLCYRLAFPVWLVYFAPNLTELTPWGNIWMNCPLIWRWLMAVGCLGAACVFTGCSRSRSELSELDDPLIRQAHARAQEGNKDMALALLNRALLRKPGLSRAHLDAALLYDQYKQDYVRAIYHYSRY